MKILLTHAYFLHEDAVEQKIMKPYPPLGLLCLSAWLKEKGIAHEVFDTTFSTQAIFLEFLVRHKPPIIGIYVNLMTRPKAISLIRQIKQQYDHTTILLGGPDVTYNCEQYAEHGADFQISGEGEVTLEEFIREFYGSKKYVEIPGLIYRDTHGNLVRNSDRTFLQNMDLLPVPNRETVDMLAYLRAWKKRHGYHSLTVSSQRGCPYSCMWCSKAVFGKSYRRRSPENVVDEIEQLVSTYHPDSLWFVDDVFTISKQWVLDFSSEMRKRGLRIPYECITRAEHLSEEILTELKNTGCSKIWIGAESGSQRIIDLMDRKVRLEKVVEMMHLTQRHGIQTGTFIMIGYPTETIRDIHATIDYLKSALPDEFTITLTYPIKGTGLYELLGNNKIIPPDWSASTDREIKFKRTYTDRFYKYAISRIVNEVNFEKDRISGKVLTFAAIKRWLKVRISALMMKLYT